MRKLPDGRTTEGSSEVAMLTDIHGALQKLMYEYGHIDPMDVDVKADVPTEEWVKSLTRPTISFFLINLEENNEKRQTSMQTFRTGDRAERRMPPRRIDLRYMVSVLTTEVEDEHQLLWRVLSTLMKHQELPQNVLPESLRRLEPPITTRIAGKDEDSRLLDIWSALGAQLHPALSYVVTVPLELDVVIEAPLVLTRRVRFGSTALTGTLVEAGAHIGGTVRDVHGRPLVGVTVKLDGRAGGGSTTDRDGRFVLYSVPNGPIKLNVLQEGKIRKHVDVNVPAERYDIVLDG